MTPFPKRLQAFTAVLAVCALALASWQAWVRPLPALGPLLLFVALEVFSEHFEVRLPSNLTLSPAMMVSMASVVVFARSGCLLGPMIVGAASGFRLYLLPKQYRPWIFFNGANIGISMFAGAAVFSTFPAVFQSSIPLEVIAAVLAAVTAALVTSAVIAASFVAEGDRVAMRAYVTRRMCPNIIQSLPFAVVGALLGRLYIDIGPAVMLLIIVPILIAREMFGAYMRVKESHDETVHLLIKALEQKDHYTAGHAERVANYARYIGEELNFMPARLERLRFAALMHDIGKLVVPNQILNKPARLTPQEFERVRLHEKVGVQMLSHIDFLRPIAPTTHGDAMHFDPDDPDHPIEPYIVMIADAFDAMTSTRAYRRALSQDVAFQELRDKASVQFHPRCVELLIVAIESRGEMHGAGFEEASEFDDAPELGLGSAGLGDFADVDLSDDPDLRAEAS